MEENHTAPPEIPAAVMQEIQQEAPQENQPAPNPPPPHPLVKGIVKMDEAEIQKLIDELTPEDLEWLKTVTMKPGFLRIDQINTLLLEACGPELIEEDLPLLQTFLELGGELETLDSKGFTPLYRCVLSGKFATAEFLLQRRAKMNTPIEGTETCLTKAIALGNDQMVALLTQYMNNPTRTPEELAAQAAAEKMDDAPGLPEVNGPLNDGAAVGGDNVAGEPMEADPNDPNTMPPLG